MSSDQEKNTIVFIADLKIKNCGCYDNCDDCKECDDYDDCNDYSKCYDIDDDTCSVDHDHGHIEYDTATGLFYIEIVSPNTGIIQQHAPTMDILKKRIPFFISCG